MLAGTDATAHRSTYSNYSNTQQPMDKLITEMRRHLLPDDDRAEIIACIRRMGVVTDGSDLTAVRNFLEDLMKAVLYALKRVNHKDRDKQRAIANNLHASKVTQTSQSILFRFSDPGVEDFAMALPLLPEAFLTDAITGRTTMQGIHAAIQTTWGHDRDAATRAYAMELVQLVRFETFRALFEVADNRRKVQFAHLLRITTSTFQQERDAAALRGNNAARAFPTANERQHPDLMITEMFGVVLNGLRQHIPWPTYWRLWTLYRRDGQTLYDWFVMLDNERRSAYDVKPRAYQLVPPDWAWIARFSSFLALDPENHLCNERKILGEGWCKEHLYDAGAALNIQAMWSTVQTKFQRLLANPTNDISITKRFRLTMVKRGWEHNCVTTRAVLERQRKAARVIQRNYRGHRERSRSRSILRRTTTASADAPAAQHANLNSNSSSQQTATTGDNDDTAGATAHREMRFSNSRPHSRSRSREQRRGHDHRRNNRRQSRTPSRGRSWSRPRRGTSASPHGRQRHEHRQRGRSRDRRGRTPRRSRSASSRRGRPPPVMVDGIDISTLVAPHHADSNKMRPVCYDFAKTAMCSHGDGCQYSHVARRNLSRCRTRQRSESRARSPFGRQRRPPTPRPSRSPGRQGATVRHATASPASSRNNTGQVYTAPSVTDQAQRGERQPNDTGRHRDQQHLADDDVQNASHPRPMLLHLNLTNGVYVPPQQPKRPPQPAPGAGADTTATARADASAPATEAHSERTPDDGLQADDLIVLSTAETSPTATALMAIAAAAAAATTPKPPTDASPQTASATVIEADATLEASAALTLMTWEETYQPSVPLMTFDEQLRRTIHHRAVPASIVLVFGGPTFHLLLGSNANGQLDTPMARRLCKESAADCARRALQTRFDADVAERHCHHAFTYNLHGILRPDTWSVLDVFFVHAKDVKALKINPPTALKNPHWVLQTCVMTECFRSGGQHGEQRASHLLHETIMHATFVNRLHQPPGLARAADTPIRTPGTVQYGAAMLIFKSDMGKMGKEGDLLVGEDPKNGNQIVVANGVCDLHDTTLECAIHRAAWLLQRDVDPRRCTKVFHFLQTGTPRDPTAVYKIDVFAVQSAHTLASPPGYSKPDLRARQRPLLNIRWMSQSALRALCADGKTKVDMVVRKAVDQLNFWLFSRSQSPPRSQHGRYSDAGRSNYGTMTREQWCGGVPKPEAHLCRGGDSKNVTIWKQARARTRHAQRIAGWVKHDWERVAYIFAQSDIKTTPEALMDHDEQWLRQGGGQHPLLADYRGWNPPPTTLVNRFPPEHEPPRSGSAVAGKSNPSDVTGDGPRRPKPTMAIQIGIHADTLDLNCYHCATDNKHLYAVFSNLSDLPRIQGAVTDIRLTTHRSFKAAFRHAQAALASNPLCEKCIQIHCSKLLCNGIYYSVVWKNVFAVHDNFSLTDIHGNSARVTPFQSLTDAVSDAAHWLHAEENDLLRHIMGRVKQQRAMHERPWPHQPAVPPGRLEERARLAAEEARAARRQLHPDDQTEFDASSFGTSSDFLRPDTLTAEGWTAVTYTTTVPQTTQATAAQAAGMEQRATTARANPATTAIATSPRASAGGEQLTKSLADELSATLDRLEKRMAAHATKADALQTQIDELQQQPAAVTEPVLAGPATAAHAASDPVVPTTGSEFSSDAIGDGPRDEEAANIARALILSGVDADHQEMHHVQHAVATSRQSARIRRRAEGHAHAAEFGRGLAQIATTGRLRAFNDGEGLEPSAIQAEARRHEELQASAEHEASVMDNTPVPPMSARQLGAPILAAQHPSDNPVVPTTGSEFSSDAIGDGPRLVGVPIGDPTGRRCLYAAHNGPLEFSGRPLTAPLGRIERTWRSAYISRATDIDHDEPLDDSALTRSPYIDWVHITITRPTTTQGNNVLLGAIGDRRVHRGHVIPYEEHLDGTPVTTWHRKVGISFANINQSHGAGAGGTHSDDSAVGLGSDDSAHAASDDGQPGTPRLVKAALAFVITAHRGDTSQLATEKEQLRLVVGHTHVVRGDDWTDRTTQVRLNATQRRPNGQPCLDGAPPNVRNTVRMMLQLPQVTRSHPDRVQAWTQDYDVHKAPKTTAEFFELVCFVPAPGTTITTPDGDILAQDGMIECDQFGKPTAEALDTIVDTWLATRCFGEDARARPPLGSRPLPLHGTCARVVLEINADLPGAGKGLTPVFLVQVPLDTFHYSDGQPVSEDTSRWPPMSDSAPSVRAIDVEVLREVNRSVRHGKILRAFLQGIPRHTRHNSPPPEDKAALLKWHERTMRFNPPPSMESPIGLTVEADQLQGAALAMDEGGRWHRPRFDVTTPYGAAAARMWDTDAEPPEVMHRALTLAHVLGGNPRLMSQVFHVYANHLAYESGWLAVPLHRAAIASLRHLEECHNHLQGIRHDKLTALQALLTPSPLDVGLMSSDIRSRYLNVCLETQRCWNTLNADFRNRDIWHRALHQILHSLASGHLNAWPLPLANNDVAIFDCQKGVKDCGISLQWHAHRQPRTAAFRVHTSNHGLPPFFNARLLRIIEDAFRRDGFPPLQNDTLYNRSFTPIIAWYAAEILFHAHLQPQIHCTVSPRHEREEYDPSKAAEGAVRGDVAIPPPTPNSPHPDPKDGVTPVITLSGKLHGIVFCGNVNIHGRISNRFNLKQLGIAQNNAPPVLHQVALARYIPARAHSPTAVYEAVFTRGILVPAAASFDRASLSSMMLSEHISATPTLLALHAAEQATQPFPYCIHGCKSLYKETHCFSDPLYIDNKYGHNHFLVCYSKCIAACAPGYTADRLKSQQQLVTDIPGHPAAACAHIERDHPDVQDVGANNIAYIAKAHADAGEWNLRPRWRATGIDEDCHTDGRMHNSESTHNTTVQGPLGLASQRCNVLAGHYTATTPLRSFNYRQTDDNEAWLALATYTLTAFMDRYCSALTSVGAQHLDYNSYSDVQLQRLYSDMLNYNSPANFLLHVVTYDRNIAGNVVGAINCEWQRKHRHSRGNQRPPWAADMIAGSDAAIQRYFDDAWTTQPNFMVVLPKLHSLVYRANVIRLIQRIVKVMLHTSDTTGTLSEFVILLTVDMALHINVAAASTGLNWHLSKPFKPIVGQPLVWLCITPIPNAVPELQRYPFGDKIYQVARCNRNESDCDSDRETPGNPADPVQCVTTRQLGSLSRQYHGTAHVAKLGDLLCEFNRRPGNPPVPDRDMGYARGAANGSGILGKANHWVLILQGNGQILVGYGGSAALAPVPPYNRTTEGWTDIQHVRRVIMGAAGVELTTRNQVNFHDLRDNSFMMSFSLPEATLPVAQADRGAKPPRLPIRVYVFHSDVLSATVTTEAKFNQFKNVLPTSTRALTAMHWASPQHLHRVYQLANDRQLTVPARLIAILIGRSDVAGDSDISERLRARFPQLHHAGRTDRDVPKGYLPRPIQGAFRTHANKGRVDTINVTFYLSFTSGPYASRADSIKILLVHRHAQRNAQGGIMLTAAHLTPQAAAPAARPTWVTPSAIITNATRVWKFWLPPMITNGVCWQLRMQYIVVDDLTKRFLSNHFRLRHATWMSPTEMEQVTQSMPPSAERRQRIMALSSLGIPATMSALRRTSQGKGASTSEPRITEDMMEAQAALFMAGNLDFSCYQPPTNVVYGTHELQTPLARKRKRELAERAVANGVDAPRNYVPGHPEYSDMSYASCYKIIVCVLAGTSHMLVHADDSQPMAGRYCPTTLGLPNHKVFPCNVSRGEWDDDLPSPWDAATQLMRDEIYLHCKQEHLRVMAVYSWDRGSLSESSRLPRPEYDTDCTWDDHGCTIVFYCDLGHCKRIANKEPAGFHESMRLVPIESLHDLAHRHRVAPNKDIVGRAWPLAVPQGSEAGSLFKCDGSLVLSRSLSTVMAALMTPHGEVIQSRIPGTWAGVQGCALNPLANAMRPLRKLFQGSPPSASDDHKRLESCITLAELDTDRCRYALPTLSLCNSQRGNDGCLLPANAHCSPYGLRLRWALTRDIRGQPAHIRENFWHLFLPVKGFHLTRPLAEVETAHATRIRVMIARTRASLQTSRTPGPTQLTSASILTGTIRINGVPAQAIGDTGADVDLGPTTHGRPRKGPRATITAVDGSTCSAIPWRYEIEIKDHTGTWQQTIINGYAMKQFNSIDAHGGTTAQLLLCYSTLAILGIDMNAWIDNIMHDGIFSPDITMRAPAFAQRTLTTAGVALRASVMASGRPISAILDTGSNADIVGEQIGTPADIDPVEDVTSTNGQMRLVEGRKITVHMPRPNQTHRIHTVYGHSAIDDGNTVSQPPEPLLLSLQTIADMDIDLNKIIDDATLHGITVPTAQARDQRRGRHAQRDNSRNTPAPMDIVRRATAE